MQKGNRRTDDSGEAKDEMEVPALRCLGSGRYDGCRGTSQSSL